MQISRPAELESLEVIEESEFSYALQVILLEVTVWHMWP